MEDEKYIIPKSDIEIKKDDIPKEEVTTLNFAKAIEKQVQAKVNEEVLNIERARNVVATENK